MKSEKRQCPPRSPRRRDLKRPLSEVSRHWHVLRFPEEWAARSKVLAAKDSVEVGAPRGELLSGAREERGDGEADEKTLGFSHPECGKALAKASARLGVQKALTEAFQELPVGEQQLCRRDEEHFSALIVGCVTPGLLVTPPRRASGHTSRISSAGLAGSVRPRAGLG